MTERWKGVRPVRFREDVYGLLDLVAREGKGITVEELRTCALRMRLEREDRRIKALQKSISLESKKRKKPSLLTKVEQILRVFRKTNMITTEDGLIRPTQNTKKLLALLKQDGISADAFFLECLVNSDFTTYWLYLKQLFKSKQITIPSSISERDKRLRDFIYSQSFPLDAWSFFIIRDLFYDFSLLNYTIDQNDQLIFSLYSIKNENVALPSFKYRFKGPDGYLHFWPSEPKDFVKLLVKVYLSLTENRWNRMIDLIVLREKCSCQVGMPERQFDKLLQQAVKQEGSYKIVLSVGMTDIFSRTTYITKALTLPYNRFGLPYSMIRIGIG